MNNDRFKFRVWDNEEKCYQESDADYCRINYNGELECMFTCDNGIGCRYEYIQDHCTIEQCTGLKDKNGKLIYEGDLVVLDGYPPLRVMWHYCEWSLFCDEYACRCNSWEESEIVGNIHEGDEKCICCRNEAVVEDR